MNLAPTKTKLSNDFHGGEHIQGFQVQEKPEGSPFKPDS